MKDKNEFCGLSEQIISSIENKLTQWQRELEDHPKAIDAELTADNCSEIIDQANKETMLSLEVQKSNRNNKILNEIRVALKKIKQGTYGICEDSGEFIETNRLLANPLARFSLEAQQEMEAEAKNRKRFS